MILITPLYFLLWTVKMSAVKKLYIHRPAAAPKICKIGYYSGYYFIYILLYYYVNELLFKSKTDS